MSPQPGPASSPHKAQAPARRTGARPGGFLAVLVIAGLAVVIAGILLLKDRRQPVAALSTTPTSGPTTQGSLAHVSGSQAVTGPFKPTSPADQLNQALTQGKPTLVFMHSTTCQSCRDMMKVVAQVYPEFAGQVALVDVDVNDDTNIPLMQALGLRYIPTIVVYDRTGKASQNAGAMKVDAFRTFLRQHALGG